MAAYCLDQSIALFANIIESAQNETRKVAIGKNRYEYQPVYSFDDLMRDDFYLPRPPSKAKKRQQVGSQLKAMVSQATRPGLHVKAGKLPESLLVQLKARGIVQ